MKKRKPYVWIVEMLDERNGQWQPTVGSALTRDEIREELKSWRFGSGDRFRPAKYERAS